MSRLHPNYALSMSLLLLPQRRDGQKEQTLLTMGAGPSPKAIPWTAALSLSQKLVSLNPQTPGARPSGESRETDDVIIQYVSSWFPVHEPTASHGWVAVSSLFALCDPACLCSYWRGLSAKLHQNHALHDALLTAMTVVWIARANCQNQTAEGRYIKNDEVRSEGERYQKNQKELEPRGYKLS